MNRYDAKENKELDKIAKILSRLDDNLGTMETTDSRAKHFFAQEKAIHEIRQLTRDAKKVDKYNAKAENSNLERMDRDQSREADALDAIDKNFDKLDDTLAKLNDSESRVKGYIEQKHALHETKRILHEAGKYDSYQADEMDAAADGM